MYNQNTANTLFFSYIHIRTAQKTSRHRWWLRNGIDVWSRRYNMISDVVYLIEEGAFDLVVGEQCFHVKSGQMIYLPAEVDFELKITGEQPLVLYWSHAELGFAQNKLNQIFQFPFVITPKDYAKAEALFLQLIDILDPENLACVLEANAVFLQLVSLYLKESGAVPAQKALRSASMQDIVKYVSSNLHRIITVKELADLAGYNPTYFSRKFKKAYGKDPIEYINDMKIKSAVEQLQYTNRSVSEIAAGLGFSDVGYFNSLFKKRKGTSPSKYRSSPVWRKKV